MRILLPFALLALVAVPAGAEHCVQPDYGRTSEEMRVADPQTGKTRYYLDVDSCQTSHGCIRAVWIYEESNGFGNLQRREGTEDDRRRFSWFQDDTCHGMINPDTRHLLS